MILSIITKQQIEQRLGKAIRYSSDYEELADEIERTTRQRISANTIKRLLGAIGSIKEPRLYTLDVIAGYLGFENWDVYIAALSQGRYAQFKAPIDLVDKSICQEIIVETLPQGSKIEFQYHPDRRLILHYIEEREFKVVDSKNSRLQVNDLIETGDFYLNYPLIVNRIMRNGLNMGRYIAGRISGLTYLKILK